MNTNDYLKMAGYSEKEWTVLDAEESKLYTPLAGSVSAMYPIKDRKFIQEIGKGYNLVNLAWMNKQDVEIEKPKDLIPSPPPKTIPKPPVKEIIEEAAIVENYFLCAKEDQTGISCDEQCDDCKTKERGPGDEIEIQKIKEIVEESGIQKENVVIASIPENDETWKAKRISTILELGLILVEDKGIYASKDNSYGISVETINNATDEKFEESINNLKKHIESLKKTEIKEEVIEEMTLQRKCSLLEKNCGMIVDPTNAKVIHLNTSVFVSFSALENMDDKAFNDFVPMTMETIAKKTAEIKAMPKVDESIPQSPKPPTTKEINIFRSKTRIKRIEALGLKEEEFQYGNGTQAISKEWIRILTDEKFEEEFKRLDNEIAISNAELEPTTLEREEEIINQIDSVKGTGEENATPQGVIETITEDAIEDIEEVKEIVEEVKQEVKPTKKATKKVTKPKVPTPKVEVKQETVKAKEEKYIPIATPKTVANFQFVDDLMATLEAFKKNTYILAKINEILASEEKDEDKISLIYNAVQNI